MVNQRIDEGTEERDLLQMILEGAESYDEFNKLSSNVISGDKIIVDNCKNIYFAGHETTAITASWSLMLLAAYPEWQDRARAEVFEICKGNIPDADMLRNMKTVSLKLEYCYVYKFVFYRLSETWSCIAAYDDHSRNIAPVSTSSISFVIREALHDIKLKIL